MKQQMHRAKMTAQEKVDAIIAMARRNMLDLENRANMAYIQQHQHLTQECASALNAQRGELSTEAECRIRHHETSVLQEAEESLLHHREDEDRMRLYAEQVISQVRLQAEGMLMESQVYWFVS